MNIVQMIMDLISSGGLGKLSSLLGENEAKIEAAVKAAVPALLAGLSRTATSPEGAQKLTSALGKIDPGSLSNLGNVITGHAGAAADQGGSLLGSLLSGDVLNGIINSLSKFSGLGGGAAKNLLGYLAPLIMGVIAKQFAGKSITPQGLTDLFASQKANIANAIPSKFSLADVPGLSSMGSAPGATYGAAKDASSSAMNWLLPVLGIAAVAIIAYFLWSKAAPHVGDAATVTKDLTTNISSLTDTLTTIKTPASVDAALPKLTEIGTKLEGMKTLVDKLPEAGKTKIAELIKSFVGSLKDQFSRVLMIPGADKLRPALDGIVSKLTALSGLPPGLLALPSIDVTNLGSKLSGMLSSLTESMTNIKDAASAEAALPKLKDFNDQIDVAKGAMEKLPEASKATITPMIKGAWGILKTQLDRVLALAGLNDSVKPIIEAIMKKVSAMAG